MCLLGVVLASFPAMTGAGDPPELGYIPPLTAYEDQVFTLDLSVFLKGEWHDGSGGNLTYQDDSPLVDTDPVTGLMVWDAPGEADVGDHFITVTVTDGEGRTDAREIRITVVHDCQGFRFPSFEVQNLTQGVPFRLDASVVHCELCYDDDWFTYSNDHHELFVIDPYTGLIDLTPANDQVGNWTVTLTATDAGGERDSAVVHLDVANVNDPPRMMALGGLLMTEGEPFLVQLQAMDPDLEPRLVDPLVPVDPGERLTYGGGLPGWEVDPASGTFAYTPSNDDAFDRTLPVTFNVTDASGEVDGVTTVLRVRNVEQPPVAAIEGLVEGQKCDRNLKVELAGLALDEWGRPWGVQHLWYLDGEYLGEGETLTWKPPYDGNGPVTLRLVVVNRTNHRVETHMNVTLTHPDYPGEVHPAVYVVASVALMAAGALMTARLMVRRRSAMGPGGRDQARDTDGDGEGTLDGPGR
jgi:hypothetical protein